MVAEKQSGIGGFMAPMFNMTCPVGSCRAARIPVYRPPPKPGPFHACTEARTLPSRWGCSSEALLKASPAPLSAEQLLTQAWDENADPFTNTVKVTIARLRRKLGPPDAIHTAPGIGCQIGKTD